MLIYPLILASSGAFLNWDLSIEDWTFLIWPFVVIVVPFSLPSCATCIAEIGFGVPTSPCAKTDMLRSELLKYIAKPAIKNTTQLTVPA